MATTMVVLAVLMDGPRHGYDVKRAHDEWFPSGRPLGYGQVYAALSRLDKDGSVEVAETRVEAGPERTVYALTRRGRERVQAWFDEPVQDPARAVGDLVAKTVAAVRTAADPRPMLARQRIAHLRRLRELRTEGAAGEALSALALDHAIEHLDADLRWLERAGEQVEAALAGIPRQTLRVDNMPPAVPLVAPDDETDAERHVRHSREARRCEPLAVRCRTTHRDPA